MVTEKINYIIIDTREPGEFAMSHVDGAINIPVSEFATGEIPEKLKDTPKDAPILLYCFTGQRSNTCSMILRSHGFTNLTNGINEGRTKQQLSR